MLTNIADLGDQVSVAGMSTGLFLLGIAALSLGIVLERTRRFAALRDANREFAKKVSPLLVEWRLQSVKTLARDHNESSLAQLFNHVSTKYLDAVRGKRSGDAVQLARREAARGLQQTGAELRRGLSLLLILGWSAPILAFLGNVVGAVSAGSDAELGIESLTQLLVTVGLGLLVTALAFSFREYLKLRIVKAERAVSLSVHDLLDEMEQSFDEDSGQIELADVMWA